MQSELIESVRALAEAQKNADATELSGKTARQSELPAIAMRLMQQRERVCFIATEMDAPALLAALERAERIEKAAQARKFSADIFYALPEGTSPDQWGKAIGAMRGAEAELDAALSEPQ